jgi:hypothetical protein
MGFPVPKSLQITPTTRFSRTIGSRELASSSRLPKEAGPQVILERSPIVGILLLFVGDYVIARSSKEATASPKEECHPSPALRGLTPHAPDLANLALLQMLHA